MPFPDLATALHPARLEPALETLTLGDIEEVELMTALDDGLDPDARDADAAPDRQFAEVEEM